MIILSSIDWHTHPYGHGKEVSCHNLTTLRSFVEEARNKNLDGIGFTDHEIFLSDFNFSNLYQLKEEEKLDIKIGIEFDYVPGKEKDINEILEKFPLEYCIGSVHDIGNWAFDNSKYKYKFYRLKYKELINLYKKYFSLLHSAVKSGLFDIIGHFDLIKIFDFIIKDRRIILDMVNPILDIMKQKSISLEINTNGLNKPVNEVYPASDIIKQAKYKNVSIVFSSDAHTSKRVGENFDLIKRFYNLI